MAYHFLEHTADLKFVAEGKTIEEAFVESSNALKEAICGDIIVLEQKIRNIKIKATGIENLVYKFLEEFIFLLESEDFLIAKVNEIKIDLKNFELDAKIL